LQDALYCKIDGVFSPGRKQAMSVEARLKELGLVLPLLAKPVANYLPYRLAGGLLFLSG